MEWNRCDIQIRRSATLLSFRNSVLKVGQPTAKSIYNIHNPRT